MEILETGSRLLFPCYFQELCERWGPQAHIYLWSCLELNRVTAHLSANVVIERGGRRDKIYLPSILYARKYSNP